MAYSSAHSYIGNFQKDGLLLSALLYSELSERWLAPQRTPVYGNFQKDGLLLSALLYRKLSERWLTPQRTPV